MGLESRQDLGDRSIAEGPAFLIFDIFLGDTNDEESRICKFINFAGWISSYRRAIILRLARDIWLGPFPLGEAIVNCQLKALESSQLLDTPH